MQTQSSSSSFLLPLPSFPPICLHSFGTPGNPLKPSLPVTSQPPQWAGIQSVQQQLKKGTWLNKDKTRYLCKKQTKHFKYHKLRCLDSNAKAQIWISKTIGFSRSHQSYCHRPWEKKCSWSTRQGMGGIPFLWLMMKNQRWHGSNNFSQVRKLITSSCYNNTWPFECHVPLSPAQLQTQ